MSSQRKPILFIGHGSPMNALANNAYTRRLHNIGLRVGKPKGVLVISAHWLTEGTYVTTTQKPKTIHDFRGFPKELFEVQYPAPGSPEIAQLILSHIKNPPIHDDHEEWGLDHGAWSVLKHMYPLADVPILQLSIDIMQPPVYHLQIGQKLSFLRDHGVIILGSGNLVHNLKRIKWESNAAPYDWAVEFDNWLKKKFEERDFKSLTSDFLKTNAGQLSVPTMEHYYPLLYILGAADSKDQFQLEFEEIQNGSISMRSVSFNPL